MLQEQLDAIRDQLMSDDNADLRQSIYCTFLKDAERGANMIIVFARDKGLELDASAEDVVQAMNTMDDEDMDIEMTPEMLANVSGAVGTKTTGFPVEGELKTSWHEELSASKFKVDLPLKTP